MISPIDEKSGFLTTLGLHDKNERGIFYFELPENGNMANIERVITAEYDNDQYLSLIYINKINCLVFHKLNGDVLLFNMNTKDDLKIYETKILSSELDISPGCTLKLDKEGNDLFVLTAPSKIVVLKNIKKDGFDSIISINGLSGHPISDFKPLINNKIAVLCLSSLFLIYHFDQTGSKILSRTLLSEKVGLNSLRDVNTFDVCCKEKYMLVAFNKNEPSRRKDKLALFDISGMNCIPRFLDAYSYHNEAYPGSPFISINMDFYHQRHPIAICSDMEGERKTEIFYLGDEKINKISEFVNNKIGFTSRRSGRRIFSVDQFGHISKSLVSIYNPDNAKVKPPPINLNVNQNFNNIGSGDNELLKQNRDFVNIVKNKENKNYFKQKHYPMRDYRAQNFIQQQPVLYHDNTIYTPQVGEIYHPIGVPSITERFKDMRSNQLLQRKNLPYIPQTNDYFTLRNGEEYDPYTRKSYLKRKKPQKKNKIVNNKMTFSNKESELFPWENENLNYRKEKNPLKNRQTEEITIRELSPIAPEKPLVESTMFPNRNINRSTVVDNNVFFSNDKNLHPISYALKNPDIYRTGFDSCINIIPVLTNFGYINCLSENRNCLAQYEIGTNGVVKQTEILKSNVFFFIY